ncbi:hypothetical protein BST27_21550, partial [Mycobacterium intermedium]
MNNGVKTPSAAVLVFGDRPLPRPLTGLPTLAVDDAPGPFERLIVVGADADLAAVLSRLLRADRLARDKRGSQRYVDGARNPPRR